MSAVLLWPLHCGDTSDPTSHIWIIPEPHQSAESTVMCFVKQPQGLSFPGGARPQKAEVLGKAMVLPMKPITSVFEDMVHYCWDDAISLSDPAGILSNDSH